MFFICIKYYYDLFLGNSGHNSAEQNTALPIKSEISSDEGSRNTGFIQTGHSALDKCTAYKTVPHAEKSTLNRKQQILVGTGNMGQTGWSIMWYHSLAIFGSFLFPTKYYRKCTFVHVKTITPSPFLYCSLEYHM